MNKSIKKLIGILAAVVLCIGLVASFAAFKAEAATTYTSGNWTYTLSSNIATITGYTGSSSSITFPTILGGYKVENIGANALKNNTSITSVVIPEGYVEIKNSAFSGCSYLKSVTIPKSMKSIGDSYYGWGNSFENCVRLETVTFTQGGTAEARINGSSFKGCTALKSVVIPANYKTIYDDAFYGCTGLQKVEIKENGDKFFERTICSGAFEKCTALTTAIIPEGFVEIKNSAFSGCSYLKSVTIPKTMKCIGDSYYGWGNTFENCVRLETVTFTQGGTAEARINGSSFKGCTALKSVVIPANYKTIYDDAFYGCTGLQSVEIKENSDKFFERTICSGAFEKCTALTTAIIPEGFVEIKNSAFSGCSYLKSVTIPKTVKCIGDSYYGWGNTFENCVRLETVTFTQGGTAEARINSSSFKGCTALKSVVIPANYKTIYDDAFYGCTGLQSVEIKENSDKFFERTICEGAFEKCTALTTAIIPEGFVEIKNSAFSGCSSLKSITIPKTVKCIGDSYYGWGNTFENCVKLETVTFTQGGTAEARINGSAFKGCTSLKSIVIPNNYNILGENVFYGCTDLSVVHIPAGVTSIGNNAFKNCPSSLTICSTSYSCTAKTYADANSIKFKLCDGNHGVVTPTPDPDPNPNPTVTYVLSYSANGGSGAPSSQSGAMSYTVSYSVPTRNGYKFLGWSKSSTSTYAAYVAGDTIILNANTTLYAVWQKNSSDTPPVAEEKIPGLVIKNNSGTKQINYGETLELTAKVTDKPVDAKIVWYVDGVEKSEGDTFKISFESGSKTVEVKLLDANGNPYKDARGVDVSDREIVTVNAGFFQKLISFIKNIFGINRTVVQTIYGNKF